LRREKKKVPGHKSRLLRLLNFRKVESAGATTAPAAEHAPFPAADCAMPARVRRIEEFPLAVGESAMEFLPNYEAASASDRNGSAPP
jgi:hypothetical protein